MLDLQRRWLGALAFILLLTLVGIVGSLIMDPDAGFIRAFFMTAITLTTVGYGQEIALNTNGARIFLGSPDDSKLMRERVGADMNGPSISV